MKKHLFFQNLFISIIILCLFFSDKTISYAGLSIWSITIKAEAASHSNTDIKHAKTLQKGQRYTTHVSSRSFHYYCIPEQEKEGEITIEILSVKKLSLSFQLYDAKGNLYPPSHYTMDSIHCKLTILYYIPAEKSYLFGLYNDKNESLSYDIIYRSSTNKNKDTNKNNNTKKTLKKSKNKTKKLTTKPPVKYTISPRKTLPKTKVTQHTASPETNTSKPIGHKKNITKKRIKKFSTKSRSKITGHIFSPQKNIRKNVNISLKLSNTFLHKKCKDTIILKATLSGADAASLTWDISTKNSIKNKYIHNKKHCSTLKLSFNQKGIYVITCRLDSGQKTSASCTVKIS